MSVLSGSIMPHPPPPAGLPLFTTGRLRGQKKPFRKRIFQKLLNCLKRLRFILKTWEKASFMVLRKMPYFIGWATRVQE